MSQIHTQSGCIEALLMWQVLWDRSKVLAGTSLICMDIALGLGGIGGLAYTVNVWCITSCDGFSLQQTSGQRTLALAASE